MKRLWLFLILLFLCQSAYANVHFESLPTNNTVASTIQAGGSITGNVANLTNGNIKQHQTIAASAAQTQSTSTTANARTPTSANINKKGTAALAAKTATVQNAQATQPPVANTNIRIPHIRNRWGQTRLILIFQINFVIIG